MEFLFDFYNNLYFILMSILHFVVIFLVLYLSKNSKEIKDGINFIFDKEYVLISIISVILADLILFLFGFSMSIRDDVPIFFFILTIFIAPISEELFFRGFLLGGVYSFFVNVKNFDNRKVKYIILAINPILFALFHFIDLSGLHLVWNTFIPRLFLGVICTLSYWSSKKNLIPSITAHYFFNILIVSGAFK